MSTINFDQLFASLQTGVISIAKESLQDYYNVAKADGESALADMKANLQRWAEELASGALTTADLEFLLKEEAALNEMTALKQAGLAKVQLDEFKGSIINLIIATLSGLLKV